MVEHYFDIETTGLDPEHDKIVTIQIQDLDELTGKTIGEMEILKEWESSEREIIEKIMPLLTCERPFDFIVVGNNLLFDFMFLSERAEKYGLKTLDLHWAHDRVLMDLKHVLVMINRGRFRGYDRLLRKEKLRNVLVPQLYRQKKYEEIVNYAKEEAKIFLEAYKKLKKNMPSLATIL